MAGMQDVEKNSWVLAPQGSPGQRAVQGQVNIANFDGKFFGHADLPLGLMVNVTLRAGGYT